MLSIEPLRDWPMATLKAIAYISLAYSKHRFTIIKLKLSLIFGYQCHFIQPP
ncbi:MULTISPECIES: hypothetical protein [unclassified Moorena]|uniref:hypothetical protein n=1 Tax=unclassified Moorena TaxID=2683338 RepID=UPI0013CC6F5C|nr:MULTISPECIES: hypothetical protein [unclassified Moorena]NEO21402.1 hypothetical protein [Moorena sp. SIO4A5]NEQ61133.1 hypothetical protein [Moorena sp. SIO4A1]